MSTRAVQICPIPSITIFVRHGADCPRRRDEFFKNCKCSKHLRWSNNGKQYRQSAKTRTWSIAEERRREVEARFAGSDPAQPVKTVWLESKGPTTIQEAVELFLSDKTSQGLDAAVLKKYERELGRFSAFMAKRFRHYPNEIGLENLTEFRATWRIAYPSSTTRSKVQERLRAFLRYCYESELIDRIPKLSPIKVDEAPTLPLTQVEYAKLLASVRNEFPAPKAARVHALIRLMRYSGLAIRDAVTLERTEVKWDAIAKFHRVVTSRQKTGTHVSVPIPPDVAKEVSQAMGLNDSPQYVFWNTGTGKPQTAVTNWQHDLRQVFRAAGQPKGHPHQLRDTFAVRLLEQGIPLEEVSKLLGHTSIKTTEKFYAQWVKARQDRLDTLVVGTWRATFESSRAAREAPS